MEECQEGKREGLIQLVKMLEYQKYCELGLKNDVIRDYLMLRKSELRRYCEGLVEKPHSVVMELGSNGVIEVNIESHELLNVSGIDHLQVLDLNDDGERWEGDVLNRKPYGWGVLYDCENRRVYEGFRIGEVNVCYGTRYYSDIQKVEYEGEWCEGKRWGKGTHYDRNGNTVFDGEWMNDDNMIEKRVVLSEENQLIHNRIEELIVENNSCNGPEWAALDLSFMSHLRLLQVSDECFMYVKEVKLIGLSKLERVVIGKNSFTREKNHWGNDPTRHFYLKNCDRLRELKIGGYSFSDYSVCEIENDSSLEVIEMEELERDSFNFGFASLELKSDSEKKK